MNIHIPRHTWTFTLLRGDVYWVNCTPPQTSRFPSALKTFLSLGCQGCTTQYIPPLSNEFDITLICFRHEREMIFKNYLHQILNMAIEHAVRVKCHDVIRKKGPKNYRIKKKSKDHRRSRGHKGSQHHKKSKNHKRSHNIKSSQGHKIIQGHESSQGSKGSKGHFPK